MVHPDQYKWPCRRDQVRVNLGYLLTETVVGWKCGETIGAGISVAEVDVRRITFRRGATNGKAHTSLSSERDELRVTRCRMFDSS